MESITLTHRPLADVDAGEWDQRVRRGYPFLCHAFLSALEDSQSTCGETGWMPFHQQLDDEPRSLIPLFVKGHSHGEFIYDWSWAHAHEAHVGPYYPKLYCGAPFTPATGPRFLAPEAAYERVGLALAALARQGRFSSVHVAYPESDVAELLLDQRFAARRDWQFHWHNRDYRDFDDFLATLRSRKRKNIVRERRLVFEQGFTFHRVSGSEASTEDLDFAAQMYARTFEEKGNWPAIEARFFHQVARSMPDHLLLVIAYKGTARQACAVFFVGDDALYGRYWGTAVDADNLHFETCYYQGIEYAIEHGLARFEPGQHGIHKIARGFVPSPTICLHYFSDQRFHQAVAQQLKQVDAEQARRLAELKALSPYRQDRS